MADDLRLKVTAAILKFLEQQELLKTARALVKETRRKEWDLEAVAAEEGQFDLLELCAPQGKRRASTQLEDSQPEGKKSKKARLANSHESPQPKKSRTQHEKETPEAEAVTSAEKGEESVGNQGKKSRGQPQQHQAEAAKECTIQGSTGESQKMNKDKGVRRFQRIDESRWATVLPEELKDNSFWTKKNDTFAVRAAEELGRVRGKDFRHEKAKKKRASWKGCGEIPMTVNSIRFDSDSD